MVVNNVESNFLSVVIRDLSTVRADVNKSVRVVQGACMDLDKNLRGMDANTQAALDEERARRQKVEFLFKILYLYFTGTILYCRSLFNQ
jgi:hypothetical protein